MGALATGQVVILPFPYSNLARRKVRPAVLLARVGTSDWLACQITSNPFADGQALLLTDHDFVTGSLDRPSYVRPGKLFTADEAIVIQTAGTLTLEHLEAVRQACITIVKGD